MSVIAPIAGVEMMDALVDGMNADFALARDVRTACEWQSMVDNQRLMMSNFQSAMSKLAVVGHDPNRLIDCSDVIPEPVPPVKKPATFPAGTSRRDLQQACPLPFPILATDRKLTLHANLKNSY